MTPLRYSAISIVFLLSRSTASVIPEHHDLHTDVSSSGFDFSSLPHGSLPSATLTGPGWINEAATGPGGNEFYESGGNFPGNHIGGHFLGAHSLPIEGYSPDNEEIHNLPNSHGVYNEVNIRDEHYPVFRDIPHHVPQPVPVPVPEKIPVPVPHPYPVPVVKNVPVPVIKIQQVHVDKPVHVPVEKIVYVPVEKVVPVPVDHPVPVERIVEVPVVNVVKVPVEVVKKYPVTVLRTVHHYDTKSDHGWHFNSNW